MTRVTTTDVRDMKDRGEKIVMMTAYDYPSARLVEEGGADLILVGDTLGMVVLGYDSTLPVTMEDMIHHTKAVVRGSQRALVVGDMPFMSYQTGWQDAMVNAARFMKEAGCGAVKLEGGRRSAETVRKLVEAGIPVMGHIGLTPQSVNQFGGFKVQGKTPAAAVQLMHDAQALEQAGAFAIVLETIPAPARRTADRSGSASRRSASAPVFTATGRCRCSTTCSASTTPSSRSTRGATPRLGDDDPRRSRRGTPRMCASGAFPTAPRELQDGPRRARRAASARAPRRCAGATLWAWTPEPALCS